MFAFLVSRVKHVLQKPDARRAAHAAIFIILTMMAFMADTDIYMVAIFSAQVVMRTSLTGMMFVPQLKHVMVTLVLVILVGLLVLVEIAQLNIVKLDYHAVSQMV
jgi:hypothetical protein